MDNAALLFLLPLVGTGLGAYIGAYLKKKGENLATHEDVRKLIDQISAVTQTTKEIESKISTDFWNRQKHWEIRRDALYEALRALADIEYALTDLDYVFNLSLMFGQPKSNEEKRASVDGWNQALLNFKRASVMAFVACEEPVRKGFETLSKLAITYANDAIRRCPEKGTVTLADIAKQLWEVIALVRAELQVV